ncbi:DUF1254 domain-containing protein [Synechococcus elongatus IITB4]|uniref:DUF1254 domain-containing protein n=1 Tax=Synechococcus elongatus TaxID=32046 RepID=UPI0030CBCCE0
MKRILSAAMIGGATVLASGAPMPLLAQAQISEQAARTIGVDAYLYFYPLVTMDITRRQLSNAPAGASDFAGPPNTFVNVKTYPPADFKGVVRPNFDTLYSSAWLDLTKEPMVVSVPNTNGRYYLLPMLDMWSDVFASPGWRTTGTQAQDFLLAPPGWSGTVPSKVTRINAPTPFVWIIGRTQTNGTDDYAAVHKIQAGYKITPLSQWGRTVTSPPFVLDTTIDMKTPPKEQVDGMDAATFFAYAAELLKVNPPHITDQPLIAQLKRLGFEAGKSFDLKSATPEVQKAFATVPQDAQKLMTQKIPTLATVTNGWSMNTTTMGVYGNYYLKRAIIAQVGLGANLPEDAIYPLNIADSTGKPLDGVNTYKLRFTKENLPPVGAFWSVTLYDQAGFQVANPLNRFAVSSWMPFVYNSDGSLDLYIQNESPGKDKEANWLPAPKGPFNLTMRLYAPASQAINGEWNPPPVLRTGN